MTRQPIAVGWKDDWEGLSEEEVEEYEEIGPPTCDECGTELEVMYEGLLICEVCGKHFTERG